MILGGCYEANKRFIKWVSSKEIGRVSIFEESTLDLDSLVLTKKVKDPHNIETSNLQKINCKMFNNLQKYREYLETK